jgi:hypothetical protein
MEQTWVGGGTTVYCTQHGKDNNGPHTIHRGIVGSFVYVEDEGREYLGASITWAKAMGDDFESLEIKYEHNTIAADFGGAVVLTKESAEKKMENELFGVGGHIKRREGETFSDHEIQTWYALICARCPYYDKTAYIKNRCTCETGCYAKENFVDKVGGK